MSIKKSLSEARTRLLFLAGIVVFGLIVFRVVLAPSNILFTTDDNVGSIAVAKRAMPHSFFGWWDDSVLAGMPGPLRVGLTTVLIWLLPVEVFVNWIHLFHLVLGSLFLTLYLRQHRVAWPACALGLLTAYWVGSNFTLTYAGHTWKFGVVMFAAAFLFLVERAARTRRVEWGFLAGAAFGGLFLEQPDVGLFFGLLLGPYLLFAAVRENGFNVPALARILVPAAVAMALLMFHPLSISLQTSRDDSTTAAKEDPGRKWDFVTQWSWPPEESIDFIAPGFTGWRSGEETGPYGGRMGRSAGWEKTGQGFRNFKLENQYLGAIPIVFGFWACLAAWGFRKRREDGWGTVFFWGIATVVALVLSFGKYFPAYYFLYLLPGFSSVRNPNKFLQVFQLGVGLLAAFGFSRALEPETGSRMAGRLEKALWGAFALLGLAALGLFAGWGNAAAALAAEGWGVAADTMVRNRVWALAHGAGMLLGAALALRWLLIRPPGNAAWRQALPWLVVAVVAADVLALSRHYVKALPRSLIEENDVVRFLKRVRGHQRVTFITQESFYNAWLTYLFPYHGIPSVNVTQMPRMPGDYEAFLGAMRPQPLRMWEMMAAEFVVGPVQLWAQVQQDPALRDAFELVYAFNAEAAPDGGVRVSAATAERPGGHCVLRLKRPAPRYAALDSWRVLPDEDALRRISARDYAPFTEALLSPSTAAGVPGAPGTRAVSNVPVQHYRPGRVELKVSTDRPVVVRAAEKYDPGWRATVDGRPAPVYRCDRVFQGVPVEPGIHEVVLSYSNAVGAFRVQIAGMVLSLLAAASLAIRREPRPAA